MRLSDVITEPPDEACVTRVLVVPPLRIRPETEYDELMRHLESGPFLWGVTVYWPRSRNSCGVICVDGSHVLYDFRAETHPGLVTEVGSAGLFTYSPYIRGQHHDYWASNAPLVDYRTTPKFEDFQKCWTRRGW